MLNSDDTNQTITFNMSKVKSLEITGVDMTQNNSGKIVGTMLQNCNNMNLFRLKECKLDDASLSFINDGESLTKLHLVDCGLKMAPNIKLDRLESICLAKNDLSSDGACDNLNKDNLPNLTNLYLDKCNISDISFLNNLGKLKDLYLGQNKLTDASVDKLLEMGETSLSELNELKLGKNVFTGNDKITTNSVSSNNFTDIADLALLTMRLPNLKELDLSGLRITSIKEFAGIRSNVIIVFNFNKINDISDIESNILENFKLGEQYAQISGNFAAGWESEIPELIKRILNPNDVLNGTLEYVDCSLSDNGKKILIQSGTEKASVKVKSGKFEATTFDFELKEIPDYTLPTDLIATEGDTLADVVLPEGFTWKDSALDVGKEGERTFKAVYTPQDTDKYIFIDDIDLLVTVKASAVKPVSPTPELPTPTPEISSTPEISPTTSVTPTPEVPTQKPETPSPTPETPAPVSPTPAPQTPTPIPPTPTPKPDESKLTGNQIEKRTDLPILLATGKQKGKSGIKLTWNKWSGCTGYEVYWSYCDGKQNFKKLKTVKSTGKRVCVHNKLKKTRAYKYYIATYRIKNGIKNYISKSSVIHVAMKQEKHTNVKKIKLNKTKLVLKPKKKFKVKATAIAEKKRKPLLAHEPKFRYYTGNKEVATVSKKGVVKARKKGTCTIYVIANNGVAKTVKVTVK